MLGATAVLPAQLAGSYTVGPGGNYLNVAAAIADLTAVGVVAPVTFIVTANDTGPWTLGAFTGQGPSNPVVFDGLGTAVISGTQPVLTLTGCASVTFRGLSGTFTQTTNSFVVNAGTTDCSFIACDFRATVAASGAALINVLGGSGLRIEDSTFGGGYESLNVGINSSFTTVQRCKILGGGFWIMRLAGTDITLANNFITGTSNYGISAGISGSPTSGANLKIWHNSVYIDHPTTSSQFCSLRWYSNAAGTEVVDNVFFDNYTAATAALSMWCSGAYRPTVMNYNCFWSNRPTYFPVYASPSNRTLAQWQGLGFDLNSFQADPMYTAPSATLTADLTLQPGSPCSATATPLPLVLTDYFLAARTAPESIGAHEQEAGPAASYVLFGAGCVGTAGVPSNSVSAPMRLGTTQTITFGNLPAPNLAIAVIGFSNTMSTMGPLPLDLTGLGAPGCFGRVSLDATTFLLGAAGSASFNFAVPSQSPLLGLPLFTQALVLDPTLNALGASTSDAAALVIGV